MYNILRNSTTGMIANQGKIDITSNNIVNAQTTGYKKLDADFLNLYVETLNKSSYPHTDNKSTEGTGVRISRETRNNTQGSLKNTGINSNLAIDGEGFFKVTKSDGSICYTRNGEFNIDASGKLVNDYGHILEVQYSNGNVDLSNGELSINKSGEIFLDKNRVGKINLYVPEGTNDLVSIGDNLFTLKEGSTMNISEDSSLEQGYIEMSNVNLGSELTDLIISQRAFQFNSKGLQAVDEMWSMINNLQGR